MCVVSKRKTRKRGGKEDDKTTRQQHQSRSEETRLGSNIKALNKGHQRRRQELEWQQRHRCVNVCVCVCACTSLCLPNNCLFCFFAFRQLCLHMCVCVLNSRVLTEQTHLCSALPSTCRRAPGSPSTRKRDYQHRWSKVEMLENKTVCGAEVAGRQNTNKAATKRSHQQYVQLDMRMLNWFAATFFSNDHRMIFT